jgi:hypothetical protein
VAKRLKHMQRKLKKRLKKQQLQLLKKRFSQRLNVAKPLNAFAASVWTDLTSSTFWKL